MATQPPPPPGAPGGNVPPWQPSYPAGAAPQMPPPQPKKGLGPLAWVLIILGGLFACFVILIVAGGLFVMHKVKQAGFDPELMKKNPALATAKMVAAFNPDVEIVSVDENNGRITVRNKKTGQTISMNASDVKNGHISFSDGKSAVTFSASGSGDNGVVEMKTSEGTTRIGGGPVSLPSWLPSYPGSNPEGVTTTDAADGKTAVFAFTTNDAPDKVISFYKSAISSAGMKESANLNTPDMSMVAAKDDAGKRELNVGVTKENGTEKVNVTFVDKK